MDDRRITAASTTFAAPLLALLMAHPASAQTAFLDALRIARPHAVTGEPAVAQRPAHTIVVNRWAHVIELDAIAPSFRHGGLEGQMTSALAELDLRLGELGASRTLLLTLDAYVERGDARDSEAAGRMLERYVAESRNRGAVTVLDVAAKRAAAVPVAVFEVASLEPLGADRDQRVRLRATLLDPRRLASADREDMAWDYRSPAPRQFVVRVDDGAAAPSSEPSLLATATHLERALSALGAGADAVDELVIHHDPDAGYRAADIRAVLDRLFDGGLPRVDYVRPQVRFIAGSVAYPAHRSLTIDARGTVVHER